MKIIFGCILLFVGLATSFAQQNEVNKNQVAEYFQSEQYQEAIDYLMPLLKDTLDIYVLNSIGYAFLMKEEISKADFFYKKANDIDSTNFTSNKYLAQIEKEKENFDQAVVHYKRMLRAQPANASLYKITGDLYLLSKKNDSSLYYYSRAYLLQSFNIKYASTYVTQLLNQKKYPIADSILTVLLSIDSVSVPAMTLGIRSAYEKKDYESAAAFSNRWLHIKPEDKSLTTSIRLAISNYEQKNFFTSFKVCDTLIKQDVLDENLYYYAARALNKLGLYKESNDLFTKCLDLAISENAEKYFFGKVDNFDALRQYKQAIASSDTAYYLFRNPLALYNMGRLYETGLKNKNMAWGYYRQYVKKANPSTAQERKVYAYLKEMLTTKDTK